MTYMESRYFQQISLTMAGIFLITLNWSGLFFYWVTLKYAIFINVGKKYELFNKDEEFC